MRARFGAIAMTCALITGCASPRLPFTPHHPAVVRSRQDLGDWRLQRDRNPFSQVTVCRLRARDGKAFYLGKAVAFRFPRRWDVHEAVYRIDGGDVQQWRDDLPALIRAGTPVDQGGVANSSAGLVWIPWVKLMSANRIAIQPRTDRAARTFHFRGLRGLLENALVNGCTPDSRFVR